MNGPYDLVVIGGGSAGYAAAATAVREGLSCAVVDGADELGGLCILRGCMPSKALLESSHRAEVVRRAAEFGLRVGWEGVDLPAVIGRKRRLVGEFAGYRQGQLSDGRFELVRGRGGFVDPHTLNVEMRGGGVRRVEGRAFLLATGSRVRRVDIAGLEEAGFWDSDQVLESVRLPESVAVLGGGAVAVELASYYAGFGVRVVLIQRGGQLLRDVDADVASGLAAGLERRGVEVLCGTSLIGVERAGAGRRVVFVRGGERREVEVEQLVCALGREPMVDGLGLDVAGVKAGVGGVGVEGTQQTNVAHIFAAGDVCGPFEVVHLAVQQGEVAARNAARLLRGGGGLERMDYRLKLFAVFSRPEVAAVGLTEREAGVLGLEVDVARYPFNDHGRSMVQGEEDGFVKLVVERASRKIAGAAVVGPSAAELIQEVVVAMHFGGTAGDLARVPHYHPTLSEIWTYPAEELA